MKQYLYWLLYGGRTESREPQMQNIPLPKPKPKPSLPTAPAVSRQLTEDAHLALDAVWRALPFEEIDAAGISIHMQHLRAVAPEDLCREILEIGRLFGRAEVTSPGTPAATPPQWAAAAERRREQAFAAGRRAGDVFLLALDAAVFDMKINNAVTLAAIERGFDQGCLDVHFGREPTTFDDPWANMAASLARTWARLG